MSLLLLIILIPAVAGLIAFFLPKIVLAANEVALIHREPVFRDEGGKLRLAFFAESREHGDSIGRFRLQRE